MFSSTAQYALRALIYIAGLPAGQSVLGEELARQTGVPQNYLSKILLALRKSGFLDATRGTGGGYRLSQPPDAIRLVDVVEVFEGANASLGCFLGREAPCTDEQPCAAHARWKNIRRQVLEFIEGTTLQDVATRPVPDSMVSGGAGRSPVGGGGERSTAGIGSPPRPRSAASVRRKA